MVVHTIKKISVIILSVAVIGVFCAYNIRMGSADASAMPTSSQKTLFGYIKSIAQCDKNCDFEVEEVRCRVRQLIKQGESPRTQVTFESMLVGGHELGRYLKKKTGTIHEYVLELEKTADWWCKKEGTTAAAIHLWWNPKDIELIPVAKKLKKIFQGINQEMQKHRA